MRGFVAAIGVWLAGASLALAGAPSLLDTAEAGDHVAAMRLASARGTTVNATAADGSTAIMYAAANGDLELVRALIKIGANVKLANQFGTSALTEAAIIGSAPIVEALLKAGADPNFRTPNGETPLMAAARTGKIDAAKTLLDAGADINAKETWGGQSALMWAAAQSQADMVKLLASYKGPSGGANLNDHGKVNQWERKIIAEPRPKDLNKGGFTPLHYAAREGCAACVQNLLAAGADPDSEDPDRETPLLLALENMHFDTAAVLVTFKGPQGGADLDKWDLFGRSPVYMAADVSTLPMKGNGARAVIPSADKLSAVDVGRLMLAAGANPNIQVQRRPPYRDVPQDRGGDGMLAQGAAPLLRAARGGDDKFVALLLEYKALVDLPSKEGITPLMAAAGVDYGARVTRGRNRTDEGVLATMDLLVKAGANVNARSVIDRSLIAGRGGAGAFGAGESVGARIAQQNAHRGSQMPSANAAPNQTALHGAAEHGFDKFIEFLVANGADLTVKDAGGRTPLDVARGAGGTRGGADAFPKTVALLESVMTAKGIPVPAVQGKQEK